jgi:soluble lytic murein transglycosylase-like protein
VRPKRWTRTELLRRSWLLGLLTLPVALAADRQTQAAPPATGWVEGLILSAAYRYGLESARMLHIAWHESRYQPDAYNRRSGASGVFQFLPSTWARVAPLAGFGGWSPFEAYANVEVAAFLMSRWDLGGFNHWRATDWQGRTG